MSDTISLTISTLTFLGANGTAIFSGISQEGARFRVVARAGALSRHPIVGEIWEMTGDFREHPKYGSQFYVIRGSYSIPKGSLIIEYLANHPDFVGIGHSKAKALYTRFGTDLTSILDAGDFETLTTILTVAMAKRLVEAWADNRAEVTVVTFLDKYGFDIRLANKLRNVWGSRATEMLRLNPYYMLAFSNWRQTDSAALKMGISRHDHRRLVAAVEAALYERLQNAHTVTSGDLLRQRVSHLLGPIPRDMQVDTVIALALAEGAVVIGANGGYQPVGAAALETRIADRIRAMLAGELPVQLDLLGKNFEHAWLSTWIAESEITAGFPLNSRQRQAVFMAATKPFCVLTGGAGVGKTTVLRVIIDVAKRLGLKITQMALAGRAAKRISEATHHPATTIAKFLHQASRGLVEVTPDSLIIVDEASMLDLSMTFRILRHLPDGARLLLAGDPAQLPPIGFGLVFHTLVRSPSVPQVELTEIHRQAERTGIPSISKAIRKNTVPVLHQYAGSCSGVSFLECAQDLIQGQLQQVTADWSCDDWKILTSIKNGPAGVNAINRSFHDANKGERLHGFPFAVGDPVMHLINDYELGLMNGTLGHITAVSNIGSRGLCVEFEGTQYFIAIAEISERLELAYAISVHKAQGSQFRRVAIVVTKCRVLDHALIYTALTRGVEQVVFLGDRDAFDEAIREPAFANLRQVGFSV